VEKPFFVERGRTMENIFASVVERERGKKEDRGKQNETIGL
tara:strand:+ start:420 stop:542 length:123 start_codon:yes stop_codon:yes gene_type:complete